MTAVLFAALMHAGWNAVVKSGPDKYLDTVMVTAGAALRETSVIFGTILGAVILREKFGAPRYAAALLVCAGAASLRF